MFLRLFLPLSLLVLILCLIPAVAAMRLIDDASLRDPLLASLAASLLLGLAGAALIARSHSSTISRPLAELTRAVGHLGTGTAESRVFPVGRSEIATLGDTFNRAGEQLTRRIAALEEDRRQLHTILSGMIEGVIALDADQRVLFANARAGELLDFAGPPRSAGRCGRSHGTANSSTSSDAH